MLEYDETIDGLTYKVYGCEVCMEVRKAAPAPVKRFYTISEYQAHITDTHRAQVEAVTVNGEDHAE